MLANRLGANGNTSDKDPRPGIQEEAPWHTGRDTGPVASLGESATGRVKRGAGE